jgi:hypothetical protein
LSHHLLEITMIVGHDAVISSPARHHFFEEFGNSYVVQIGQGRIGQDVIG